MGLANRAAIANELMAAGWAPQTPAAVLIGISHEGQHAWHGTLDAVHSAAIEDQENLPGIIVVGAVTALAAIIAAQEREPSNARTSASLG
jgi:siroheme synthase